MTQDKKQTAVEFIIGKMPMIDFKNDPYYRDILEQTLAIQKEQIIESYCQGCLDISKDETIFPRETSEEYYNETFNKNNQ